MGRRERDTERKRGTKNERKEDRKKERKNKEREKGRGREENLNVAVKRKSQNMQIIPSVMRKV